MARSPEGTCKLRGRYGQLTKEHIPAKGGYKGISYRVQVLSGDKVLQGGRGDQYAYEGFPARIAKQVVSTLIALAEEGFTDAKPHLRDFVLDRERRLSPDDLHLTMYLCPTSTGRSTGVAAVMDLAGPSRTPHTLIEFALQPFGYVLTLGGEPLDSRPVSIAWFGSCAYDQQRIVDLPQIPVLPTHAAIPGDYRTKYEIRRDVITNVLIEQDHPTPKAEADRRYLRACRACCAHAGTSAVTVAMRQSGGQFGPFGR